MISKLRSVYRSAHALQFIGCMFIFGVVAGMYTGSLNNYLHEVLSITKMERGIVEFPRELPGLLLFVILAFLYRFSEMKVMRFALGISFLGVLGLWGLGNARWFAIPMIILYSTGEHMMMPIRQSVAMHMAEPGKEGIAMGGVVSLENIGHVIGAYLVPLIFLVLGFFLPGIEVFTRFRTVFLIAAVILFMGFLLASFIREQGNHIPRKKIYFKKKFMRYYILEVFFGARKQVFLTFAPYVLIVIYGARTELISFLYGIKSLGNIFLSPVMGRILDRFGYKRIIVVDAFILILLCVLYGFSHRLFPQGSAFIIVCIIFVIDAILFIVGMARAMYAKSLCDTREEVTTVLSSGISINHLVSIVIAVLGGVLWEYLGIEVLFSLAALLGAGSFLFSLTLHETDKKEEII